MMSPLASQDGHRIVITVLEAQQRYLSYRATLVAIVLQNLFVLVLMGYRTIIARYVAKWGIAQAGVKSPLTQSYYKNNSLRIYFS